MSVTRAYNSPLREEKARATRESVLEALHALLEDATTPDEIGFDAIARRAGIERRTVFRHFATKNDLYAAFWPWLNARIGVSPTPQDLADIVDGPRRAFQKFDAHDAAVRAALHSRTGREMRAGAVESRRILFAKALAPVCDTLPPEEARWVEALAHLLYSASAWEVLKDYGGLSGAQAGEAASWALEVILSAITEGRLPAGVTSHRKEEGDDV